jgi:hypothetical protein
LAKNGNKKFKSPLLSLLHPNPSFLMAKKREKKRQTINFWPRPSHPKIHISTFLINILIDELIPSHPHGRHTHSPKPSPPFLHPIDPFDAKATEANESERKSGKWEGRARLKYEICLSMSGRRQLKIEQMNQNSLKQMTQIF